MREGSEEGNLDYDGTSMWKARIPGGVCLLLVDQSNLGVKSDLLTRFLKELVSILVDFHTVSRNLEDPGRVLGQ